MLPPIIYVWLGAKFPKYAIESISFALKHSGHPIVLLTSGERPKGLPEGILWVNVDDFYDDSVFQTFRKNSPMDSSFRGGFWLSVSERFFVLSQYCEYSKTESFFHAEFDVLLFNLSELRQRLFARPESLFIPRDRPDRATASLIFVQDINVLNRLCDFLTQNSNIGIEMFILQAFLDSNSDISASLPAGPALLSPSNNEKWASLHPQEIHGIVDATDLGRYLFGLDPRNTEYLVKNHFQDEFSGREHKNSESTPEKYDLKVLVDISKSELLIEDHLRNWQNVFAVHVHSKQFNKVTNTRFLNRLTKRHNAGKSTVISYNISRRLKRVFRRFAIFRWLKTAVSK